jgi:catechol 2,3-dioxygenase-like lactoylglutathione lyase family enzyme
MAPVRATQLNHVSVPAVDMQASLHFYEELFGMERIPAPNFGMDVRWLRLGDLELHLFEVADQPGRTYQHFALEVDDLESVYRRALELGAFEEGTRFRHLWELPNGIVQMYLRDPSDNLIEIDWPDVSALDRSVFGDDLKQLVDLFPQNEENLRATLFLTPRRS